MKVYDTLIIGSGYFSIGYAAACPNTVICEEHQICDTGFYLPLRSFRHKPYSPKTEAGTQLLDIYQSLSLFREEQQNTNGFEFALCKYLVQQQLESLLKCRVIRAEQMPDHLYDVTVQTNEGLTHLLARNILDTRSRSGEKRYTVLFLCPDIEKVRDSLLGAFDDAQIEPAFYPGRYALHISAPDTDENRIKLRIYEKWRSLGIDASILYMAPVFYSAAEANALCDEHYENPIEAFEAGYFYAKEAHK